MSAFLLLLLLGLFSGLLASMCGVGGGLILVPLFVLFCGLSQSQAVATSLAIIIPTALVGTLSNVQAGIIDWKVVLPVALGAVISAWFGSVLMRQLDELLLRRIFASLMLVVGSYLFFLKK